MKLLWPHTRDPCPHFLRLESSPGTPELRWKSGGDRCSHSCVISETYIHFLIIKSTTTTRTTQSNDEISLTSSKYFRVPGKKNARVHFVATVASNFAFDYSVWSILQEKVCKTCITDLNDLKHRIGTKWTKLDHAIIVEAVCQSQSMPSSSFSLH